jgi:hypothetical protein
MKTFPPHSGSDWRYKKGCRCDDCRKAHAKYETKRRAVRQKEKAGLLVCQENLVQIKEAQKHIKFLESHGIGPMSIKAETGICQDTIHKIGRGLKKHCTKKVEQKILALGINNIYEHQLLDTAEVKRMVNEMKAKGYKKHEIGTMLGYKDGVFTIRKKMYPKKYKKFVALHSKICAEEQKL